MNAPRKRRTNPADADPEAGSVAPNGTAAEHDRAANANGNGVAHVEFETATDTDAEVAVESSENGHAVEAESIDRAKLKQGLESLVFVSDRIVTPAQLGRAIKARAALVRELMAELMQDYQGRGIELVEVGNGYQFRSAPACAPFVREFVTQKPVRLTRAQLETLALIAYRQPITRPEIDEIRGVDSGSAMRVLLERNLIKMIGRKDEPGRPLLYGSSPDFLEFFGMRSLKDLPSSPSSTKRIGRSSSERPAKRSACMKPNWRRPKKPRGTTTRRPLTSRMKIWLHLPPKPTARRPASRLPRTARSRRLARSRRSRWRP
jgi:segregation and condensation protein B